MAWWKRSVGLFGSIAVRRIYCGDTRGLTSKQATALRAFAATMVGRSFASPVKVTLAYLKVPQRERSRVFCSELVALAYMKVGLLRTGGPGAREADAYLPHHFASDTQSVLPLAPDVLLSPCVTVTFVRAPVLALISGLGKDDVDEAARRMYAQFLLRRWVERFRRRRERNLLAGGSQRCAGGVAVGPDESGRSEAPTAIAMLRAHFSGVGLGSDDSRAPPDSAVEAAESAPAPVVVMVEDALEAGRMS